MQRESSPRVSHGALEPAEIEFRLAIQLCCWAGLPASRSHVLVQPSGRGWRRATPRAHDRPCTEFDRHLRETTRRLSSGKLKSFDFAPHRNRPLQEAQDFAVN